MGHYQLDCGCYVTCHCIKSYDEKPKTAKQIIKDEIESLKYYIKTNKKTLKEIKAKINKMEKRVVALKKEL